MHANTLNYIKYFLNLVHISCHVLISQRSIQTKHSHTRRSIQKRPSFLLDIWIKELSMTVEPIIIFQR